MAVDIDQRVDRTMNADGGDPPEEDRMRAVVEAIFLGADDAGLRGWKNRHAAFLAPFAEAEAIFAAQAPAASRRNLHLAAVEDVDRKAVGTADGGVKSARAVHADDH